MIRVKTKKYLKMVLAAMGLAAVVSSCDMMHQDTDDCPKGLYVKFKYDYNMQRADMFADHVGSVTLYVFDEQGKLVKKQEETNTADYRPLAKSDYTMHITDLPAGKYQLIALAGQNSYAEQLNTQRAKFVRTEPALGDDISALNINLDRKEVGTVAVDGKTLPLYIVENNALPLDTLWHGQSSNAADTAPATVVLNEDEPTYTTISMVRDTKKINVTLRELDDPTTMKVEDYDFQIIDRNSHLLYNNALDESAWVKYTPHAAWNTSDSEATTEGGYGQMAHVDFMTSRLWKHENNADNAQLIVSNKETGERIISVDLIDLLARCRTTEDYIYGAQEFLDREYDYKLSFFLRGGKLRECVIQINTLSWSVRVQYNDAYFKD